MTAGTTQKIVLGTRGSPLALAQTEIARTALAAALGVPANTIETRIFVTQGDRAAANSLEKIGGKGVFTAELEKALAGGEIDVAVHSAKDLPTTLAAGTALAGCLTRGDARDVLVFRKNLFGNAGLPPLPPEEFPENSAGTEFAGTRILSAQKFKIATGSPRRRAQAQALFPNAEFCEIRGNIHTRLRKIAAGTLADATLLAAAGLARLGLFPVPANAEFSALEFRALGVSEMVPAAGQGAIALQTRAAEAEFFERACDAGTTAAVAAERAQLAAFGAGCHTAFAAHFAHGKMHIFRGNAPA